MNINKIIQIFERLVSQSNGNKIVIMIKLQTGFLFVIKFEFEMRKEFT